MSALHFPSKSQTSKVLQWCSNVSGVLLDRLNCGAVGTVSVVNDEIREELQDPFSTCYNAPSMASAVDDNATAWSLSHVNSTKTGNDRGDRRPLAYSDPSSPSSINSYNNNSNRSTPTRSSRRQGFDEERQSNSPSHQQLQASSSAASCETPTTASMNTRHSVQDSLDEDDEDNYVDFDAPSLTSSTFDLVKKHSRVYPPYVSRVNNNSNKINGSNKSGSPKSMSNPLQIFRDSVITTPRKQRVSPTSSTNGIRHSIVSSTTGVNIPARRANDDCYASSPDRSTIPTNREHHAKKKELSTTHVESPHLSLVRMDASHYFHVPPTSSITSISVRHRRQRRLISAGGARRDMAGVDDSSSVSDYSCSTMSSLSSGEHEFGHRIRQKQDQSATNLRRLLMERKPLCVNQ